jgi:hypothetical protein
MPGEAGGASQGDRQVRFPEADVADHDGVGMSRDEVQAKQILDLHAVDLFGPAPLELIESFDDREAGIPDAAFGAPHVTHGELAIDDLGQIVHVRALLLGGLARQVAIVLADVAQAHLQKLILQPFPIMGCHHRSPCSR